MIQSERYFLFLVGCFTCLLEHMAQMLALGLYC